MSKAYIKELIAMGNEELVTALAVVNANNFRESLQLALKEQDKDTRHACAEIMYKLPVNSSGIVISRERAYNACMNTEI